MQTKLLQMYLKKKKLVKKKLKNSILLQQNIVINQIQICILFTIVMLHIF